MQVFKINYRKLIDWLIPERLKHPVFTAMIKASIWPIRKQYTSFHLLRNKMLYKLSHNQHVAHLEGVLNDRFDNAFRRISIEDAPLDFQPKNFYRASESKPVYIYEASENKPLFLFTDYETKFGGFDFVVMIPVTIPFDSDVMVALINEYRTPGMGYKIVQYESV